MWSGVPFGGTPSIPRPWVHLYCRWCPIVNRGGKFQVPPFSQCKVVHNFKAIVILQENLTFYGREVLHLPKIWIKFSGLSPPCCKPYNFLPVVYCVLPSALFLSWLWLTTNQPIVTTFKLHVFMPSLQLSLIVHCTMYYMYVLLLECIGLTVLWEAVLSPTVGKTWCSVIILVLWMFMHSAISPGFSNLGGYISEILYTYVHASLRKQNG